MKSLNDLLKIKNELQAEIKMRDVKENARVVVAMGTCGIEAGARDVLLALVDVKAKLGADVTITQNGYIEKTGVEPIVEVTFVDGKKVRYGNVSVNDAKDIITSTVNNKVVDKLVVESK